jgi:2-phosphosulfolactate phosphatase
MSAPDLPPPPSFDQPKQRPLAVHLHASDIAPADLRGCVVVVIDAIRASVTIAQALANGATRIIPVLTAEDARRAKAALLSQHGASPSSVLLGGERGGVLIDGFDLDNSPFSYTRERVAGRTIVFTTSNGTAGLLHAREAAEVIVGSFVNVSAVCERIASDPRPVHIIACGTRHELSMDDCLPAGAMVEQLLAAGRELVTDDAARLCLCAWRACKAESTYREQLMQDSRGGRNMVRIGLTRDVNLCATPDAIPVVPIFDVGSGAITLAR